MTTHNGGPAFPRSRSVERDDVWDEEEGMSLRDWFAGMALQGLISRIPASAMPDANGLADFAYEFADLMLLERQK